MAIKTLKLIPFGIFTLMLSLTIQAVANGVIPDLKGAYELEEFTVEYSNGQIFNSENSFYAGQMSITSDFMFQGIVFNRNPVVIGGTYVLTPDKIELNIIGNYRSELSYTWDGKNLTTIATNPGFIETSRWKRLEDLSSTSTQHATTFKDGFLHIPNIAIPDGQGGTVHYNADLAINPRNEKTSFDLISVEKN